MRSNIVAVVLVVGVWLSTGGPAWAQKNNRNKQDEKRENQRVAAAQRDLKNQQQELSEAEQKLRGILRASNSLISEVAKARGRLRTTREQVADRLAQSMGIDAALHQVKISKAKLAAYSQPILESLHKTENWIAAKKAADEAKDEIEKLREEPGFSEGDFKKKFDELTQMVLQPAELERLAVVATPEGKLLTKSVTESLAAVEKIRRAIPDEKIEAEPSVVQAYKTLEKAESDLKKHGQSIGIQRAAVQKLEQQLLQSRQKLEQAQAADARDKNR